MLLQVGLTQKTRVPTVTAPALNTNVQQNHSSWLWR